MKKLTQKLAQLIDNLPRGDKKQEVIKDYLDLKLSKDNMFYLTLQKKYKDEL